MLWFHRFLGLVRFKVSWKIGYRGSRSFFMPLSQLPKIKALMSECSLFVSFSIFRTLYFSILKINTIINKKKAIKFVLYEY